jgi:2-dehydro-3-deoxyphosphogluconate aldolase/(4S)-4-hydroxy-2-oxoglutarate aldolase
VENTAIKELISTKRLIAILRGIPLSRVEETVEALLVSGIRLLEFTFEHGGGSDPGQTAEKIALVHKRYADEIVLGCGTVLTREEADCAKQAGASMFISPHTDTALIQYVKAFGGITIPGAFTPSEILLAYQSGADYIKLFPADQLSVSYVKALKGPLGHIPLLAVGGIMPESIAPYLSAGVIGFGIGSPLTGSVKHPLSTKDITARAKAFTGAVRLWEDKQREAAN